MKKTLFLALVVLSMLSFTLAMTTTTYGQGGYVAGHRPTVITVFDAVHLDSTAADTSAAINIADCQYFTVFVSADTVGGETVDVDLGYELSYDGDTWAIPVGETSPATFISGFTGYSNTEYYKALQVECCIRIRFISTGTATNGGYTYFSTRIVKQP